MQVPGSDDLARRAALQRRIDAHMRWKAEFFKSRPPLPYIPKRRRYREPIAGAPVHIFFKRAMEIATAPPRAPLEGCAAGGREGGCAPALTSGPTTAAAPPEEVFDKRTLWLKRMADEMNRREPFTDIKIRSDPWCTVVVSNLHPKTLEEDIRLFCEQFGRVVSVRLIFDFKGRSRRYGFVEFGREEDARRAIANTSKKRLHGRAVVVDKERGRQQPNFLPRRMARAVEVRQTPTLQAPPLLAALTGKRQRTEKSAEVTECGIGRDTKPLKRNKTGRAVSGGRDEVDVFLDDILNL
ncbi:putative RNA recognition motif (a k a RRM RBD or RNP domain) [Trypanosoma vivax]|uniref:Putative U1 small nuclear ribonucleoprotein n=1 Tax=Trypanosoma vivax (strain Y486) TaxID=1055687 RepID=G0U164_TRYVY|nr:putative U1 small nuclear ribonucleoprotein [Trypanosoma vivax]KAH8609243.1 putative RNA recognition motif (a k a RRM RBD or RNP domain) [Trypanosoma vivax]KAH8620045.1 putative RNA recognition motif (a k a RRM RBD or RNP domain) [Trypanosoma vivax]CCC49819.1 putative U1 small nuclear ribonucleoprotein [Trypanosoma vivax Y486]